MNPRIEYISRITRILSDSGSMPGEAFWRAVVDALRVLGDILAGLTDAACERPCVQSGPMVHRCATRDLVEAVTL